jgi:hypothetical protein
MINTRVVMAKTIERAIVIRLRFFSTIPELAKELIVPPKASDSPPPLPECKRMKKIRAKDTIV